MSDVPVLDITLDLIEKILGDDDPDYWDWSISDATDNKTKLTRLSPEQLKLMYFEFRKNLQYSFQKLYDKLVWKSDDDMYQDEAATRERLLENEETVYWQFEHLKFKNGVASMLFPNDWGIRVTQKDQRYNVSIFHTACEDPVESSATDLFGNLNLSEKEVSITMGKVQDL